MQLQRRGCGCRSRRVLCAHAIHVSAARPRRGRRPGPRLAELRITIADIQPPIWRHVRVPDAFTLHQLHRVIQLPFGWLDHRRYAFRVGERHFEEPDEEAEGEDSTATLLRDLRLTA